jgi:hypothetical protein
VHPLIVLQENGIPTPIMKYIRSVLLFALSSKMASAAITITITPDNIGGTTFAFSQSTTNPDFPIADVQGSGFSIALPPSIFNPAVIGKSGTPISGFLNPIFATFADSGSGFNYDVNFLLIGANFVFAELYFDRIVFAAPGQIEGRLDLLPGAPVTSTISPMALVPGTHTIESNLFDVVTVVVIPEPTSLSLLLISTLLLASRHRSCE